MVGSSKRPEQAKAAGRAFVVKNGLHVPAPTPENPRAERRLEIGHQVSEAELVAVGVDIAEAIEHGDLEDTNPPAAMTPPAIPAETPVTEE